MSDSIVVALITGGISLIGIVASYKAATTKVQNAMETQLAVMRSEMQAMKEDIKEHNHYAKLFAESMPVVKEQIKVLSEKVNLREG